METRNETQTPPGEMAGIRIPLERVNPGNLERLLAAKGELIKKSLGISELPVETRGGDVIFDWFAAGVPGELRRAGEELIEALCRESLKRKKIIAKDTHPENEKYAYRALLLRLGFIGGRFRPARRILLRNLKGDSAFRIPRGREAAHGA